MYLCAEWEAEKGGRMGCLMKEKIQGLAERKAFILLFVIVFLIWKPYIPGNYRQARLSRQPAHSDGLHVPPPPF